jgi:hypothetical protein
MSARRAALLSLFTKGGAPARTLALVYDLHLRILGGRVLARGISAAAAE